jgi:predicted N-acetyltransferase YhbS
MADTAVRVSQGLALRAPRRRDAAAIARLLDQFGYPARPEDVAARLDRAAANPATHVLVATTGGVVVGIAAVHFLDIFEGDSPLAALILLIVDEQHRGHGTGTALVRALEGEAKARGSFGIAVHSGELRVGAHAFYRHLGYELTGERMRKLFSSTD